MGSYRKNLILQLGPLQAGVDLHAVVPTKRSNLHRLCPEHHVQLRQAYICEEGDHRVTEWVSGLATPEGWRIVNPEEKPSFEADSVLTFLPVPVKELEGHTFSGSSMYYCQPTNAHAALTWEILRRTVAKKVALVATGALRKGAKKLWRLGTFRGYLVLDEIVFPEDVKQTPEIVDVKVDRTTQTMVNQFVEKLSTSWEDVDTSDVNAELLDRWLSTGELVPMKEGENKAPAKDSARSAADLQDAIKAAMSDLA